MPVIVDAGLRSPSDASLAMEVGVDAVLVNTAIAEAGNPIMMARAFRQGVEAGRRAYLSGGIDRKKLAEASSPPQGVVRQG